MRIGRRRLSAAIAGLVLVILVAVGAIALVRWKSAGVAHKVLPPGGATTQIPQDEPYATTIRDRASIIAYSMRNDRGRATVRMYALPPNSPWLQSRQLVATQLDHWEQLGDCADRPDAWIIECAWREPTRWWPREVQLTMLRPPAGNKSAATIVIIGSSVGD